MSDKLEGDTNNDQNEKKKDENLDESSVTMLDVLEQEQSLEENTLAVLGASDDKFCTYSKGYVKRQALYSCLTCSPEAKIDPSKSAGICLACSYHCHENHELVELYTKRNFRCDCGGIRMPNVKCSLEPVKNEENSRNSYNQNFSGLYCFCHRPYPDPEDPIEDEMIQCIICEDWYHCRHLDAAVPNVHNFFEMICGECSVKNEFLVNYMGLAIEGPNETKAEDSDSKEKDVIIDKSDKPSPKLTGNEGDLKNEMNQCVLDILNIIKVNVDEKGDEVENKAEKHHLDDEILKTNEPETKKMKLEDEPSTSSSSASTSLVLKCTKPQIQSSYKKGATFWPDNWRQHLCKCDVCLKNYKNLNVEFLLDMEDTVQSYEESGKNKIKESDYERGMRALSTMERTQQIDAISAYNKMREKLKEFLHTFVVNRQVVTEEDVHRFFRMMKTEEKQQVGQPYFCR